ncbi:MAG TPA: DUF1223 domain-containing protein [Vicinamibacterales bacterium]|nr:DUF1223 domain-containing protein [Vicinamibacterales bacterium]
MMRAAALALVVLGGVAAVRQGPAPLARMPVVVELFTSEGCSSCPPADDLLGELAKGQPIAGAEVVPLALHVDYWDRQGWKDPYSSADATRRQQVYGRVLNVADIYTPQMIVDGRTAFVGSDADQARRAIAEAARRPHAAIELRVMRQGGEVTALATFSAVPPEASQDKPQIVFAVIQGGLVSTVTRGENGGRTLHHEALVRHLWMQNAVKSGVATQSIALDPTWGPDHLSIAAFLQGRRTRAIYGAAIAPLPKAQSPKPKA